MTLQEYIDQTEPQKMPNVLLERSEIQIGKTINNVIKERSLTLVWIVDGCAELLWGIAYVLVGDDKTLWTTDEDGNPKKRSCFSLK